MRVWLKPLVFLAVAALAACHARDSAAAGAQGVLETEHTIALPGVIGRIDHMAVDVAHHRLFVAELGNGSVEAIDLVTGKSIARLNGLKEPQGVAYLPDLDQLVVATGEDGMVRFLRARDLTLVGELELGDDADNAHRDPRTGRVIVAFGDGALADIDPAARKVVGETKLGAHPEGFAIDPESGRAYVNLPNARRVAAVDLAAGRELASWPQGARLANFPMALSADGATAAAVFRAPARLVLYDTSTGAVRAGQVTCGDADDAFFDATRGWLYVSCGEGAVDVFEGQGARWKRIARVPTGSGGRTSLFVPELDRLFVAVRASAGGPARILVLRPRA